MAKQPKPPKTVETLTHEDASRKNIPTAEYQSVLQKNEQSPVRLAFERRNRDLDPLLVWRGKDEQDWSDLVVHAPPLYIQEKVHPKVLIDDLRRMSVDSEKWRVDSEQLTLNLFADFNGIPEGVDKTDFYQHDQNWSNRMILGDSLQVMASLAEREGLRGKVQCIYFDPPYGIKFNSNFQWSTTSRDVKDGNADHITREPEHPDAQRRFRVMTNVEELQRALDFPWEKWTVFLHPEQRQWVEKDYSGPARVAGSAGTGKTIVALHRAVFLARANPDARVLLTTFSETLASALRTRLKRLVSHEPRLAERLDVYALPAIGKRLYKSLVGPVSIAPRETVQSLLAKASKAVGGHSFSAHFLLAEWEQVVDAWQLETWEAYRDVTRLGRKTRLTEPARATLWAIFEHVRAGLSEKNLLTEAGMFNRLATAVARCKTPVFDFAVVDEAQDIGIPQVRFFAALGGARPDALFFAGDLGQRIFQQPFSWKSLGVDVRGRSRTLRVNYRTSHQIRRQADLLLGPEVSDVDGNVEVRSDAVSVFNGPEPSVQIHDTQEQEIETVSQWLKARIKDGLAPHECGVFVRSKAQIGRAHAAVQAAGITCKVLDEHVNTTVGHLSLCTMHLAKGLEFRAVAVMACDDEVIPLQERIETVGDDADLQDVYDTERHLLYVACTRARDHLLVTATAPASEFLDDMQL